MKLKNTTTKLIKNKLDYYLENGFKVFTEEYHLKRGYCCKNGCRHCPYHKKDLTLNYEMERTDPLAIPTIDANNDKPE
jgi:hypothetical protein